MLHLLELLNEFTFHVSIFIVWRGYLLVTCLLQINYHSLVLVHENLQLGPQPKF